MLDYEGQLHYAWCYGLAWVSVTKFWLLTDSKMSSNRNWMTFNHNVNANVY